MEDLDKTDDFEVKIDYKFLLLVGVPDGAKYTKFKQLPRDICQYFTKMSLGFYLARVDRIARYRSKNPQPRKKMGKKENFTTYKFVAGDTNAYQTLMSII